MVVIIKKGTTKSDAQRLLNKAFSKGRKGKLLKYAGLLKAEIDPLVYQKMMRDEWK
jgi:hypothetical protein